jgi:hypothetical protein
MMYLSDYHINTVLHYLLRDQQVRPHIYRIGEGRYTHSATLPMTWAACQEEDLLELLEHWWFDLPDDWTTLLFPTNYEDWHWVTIRVTRSSDGSPLTMRVLNSLAPESERPVLGSEGISLWGKIGCFI